MNEKIDEASQCKTPFQSNNDDTIRKTLPTQLEQQGRSEEAVNVNPINDK